MFWNEDIRLQVAQGQAVFTCPGAGDSLPHRPRQGAPTTGGKLSWSARSLAWRPQGLTAGHAGHRQRQDEDQISHRSVLEPRCLPARYQQGSEDSGVQQMTHPAMGKNKPTRYQ